MVVFSPKLEIINHFDELINRVDIDNESALEIYSENQVLGDFECFEVKKRNGKLGNSSKYKFVFSKPYKSSSKCDTDNLWTKRTKVTDYLNQIRIRIIEELRKVQEDSLQNSTKFSHLRVEITNKEDLRSKLFDDKFYFQIQIPPKTWIFNLFTIVTDFYMSQSDIDTLQMFFEATPLNPDSTHILNEKMVLIHLLYEHIFQYISTQKIPNNLIEVSKQGLLDHIKKYLKGIELENGNIRAINLTNNSWIDLSKLEHLSVIHSDLDKLDEIKIEGLSSIKVLHLRLLKPVEVISIESLNSLKEFDFQSQHEINTELQKHLFNKLLNRKIEKFHFKIETSLDNVKFEFIFNRLRKRLVLYNVKCEQLNSFDFIFDLIEKLDISHSKSKDISKLLDFYNFPNLLELEITNWETTKIKRNLFSRLTTLKRLCINYCPNLRVIDKDSFSNLKQLVYLNLSINGIESINQFAFYDLVNLKELDLSDNKIKSLNEKMFSRLERLKKLYTFFNPLLDDYPYYYFLPYLKKYYVYENFFIIFFFQYFFFLFILSYLFLDKYSANKIFDIFMKLFHLLIVSIMLFLRLYIYLFFLLFFLLVLFILDWYFLF